MRKLPFEKVSVVRLYFMACNCLISIEEHLCFGIFGIVLRADFGDSYFTVLTISGLNVSQRGSDELEIEPLRLLTMPALYSGMPWASDTITTAS